MNTRSKVALLACMALAAVAWGPIASASATAQWHIEGKELTGKETVNVTSTTPVVFRGTLVPLGGPANKLECEKVAARPQPPTFHYKEEEEEWYRKHPLPSIESLTKGTWPHGMYFSGCRMVEPNLCKVSNILEGSTTEQNIVGSDEAMYYKFINTAGFMSYTVTGCASEGKMFIEGDPQCKWPFTTQNLAATHTCEFTTASGSTLRSKGEITMTGVIQFELAGINAGKKWNIR
jgi:hypothetical protein